MTEIRFQEPIAGLISRAADALNGPTAGPPGAITFGALTVYLVVPDERLRRHEAKHREQARRCDPWWAHGPFKWWGQRVGDARFISAYIAEHERAGYVANKYEAESRAAEDA